VGKKSQGVEAHQSRVRLAGNQRTCHTQQATTVLISEFCRWHALWRWSHETHRISDVALRICHGHVCMPASDARNEYLWNVKTSKK